MAIEVIATLKPKNNGTFPIAEAKDIDVGGTRLDQKLEEMEQNSGDTGTTYIIGNGLKLEASTNTLSVDMATTVASGNNKPVTAAAVYTEMQKIVSLISTL